MKSSLTNSPTLNPESSLRKASAQVLLNAAMGGLSDALRINQNIVALTSNAYHRIEGSAAIALVGLML